jgi:hypothetical protein
MRKTPAFSPFPSGRLKDSKQPVGLGLRHPSEVVGGEVDQCHRAVPLPVIQGPARAVAQAAERHKYGEGPAVERSSTPGQDHVAGYGARSPSTSLSRGGSRTGYRGRRRSRRCESRRSSGTGWRGRAGHSEGSRRPRWSGRGGSLGCLRCRIARRTLLGSSWFWCTADSRRCSPCSGPTITETRDIAVSGALDRLTP